MEQAIFAAGNFWSVQDYFDKVPGIVSSFVGYTGGSLEDPTYEDVGTHSTGHAQAIHLEFDTEKVTYETLCRHFFRMHNPTQLDRQGNDSGDEYRSAIFYLNEDQKQVAEKIRDEAQSRWSQPIVTQIEPAGPFYEAEPYHQKYAARTGRGLSSVPYEP